MLNNLAADPEEYKNLVTFLLPIAFLAYDLSLIVVMQTLAAVHKRKHITSADLSRERATLEFLERACKGANPVPDCEEITSDLSSITTLSPDAIEIFVRCRAEKSAAAISDLPQVTSSC